MSQSHGTIHWNELNTHDVEAAKAYYGQVCGWTFQTMPMEGGGEYTVGMLGEDMVAGIFDISTMPGGETMPAHWLTYFCVDDVDAATEASTAAGGKLMRPATDVPQVGRFSIVQDATGAGIGLMTPSDD